MDHFEANALLDHYERLLTPRQQEICALYFREDLSYLEISQELGISKAAIQDCLSKSLKALRRYESILQLERHHRAWQQALEQCPQFYEHYQRALEAQDPSSENLAQKPVK